MRKASNWLNFGSVVFLALALVLPPGLHWLGNADWHWWLAIPSFVLLSMAALLAHLRGKGWW